MEVINMVNKINNFDLHQIAVLKGLSSHVTQATSFNNNTDFYEYSLQYSEPTQVVSIYKSADMDGGSWDTESVNTDRQIDLSKYITLSGYFGGHTQTLFQDGGYIVTGMRRISFSNLKTFLDMSSATQYNHFFENYTNNSSWKTLNKYLNGTLPLLDISKFKWSTNFIGLRNKPLNEDPKDGAYVNIIGVNDLVPNAQRAELVVTADGENALLAVNNAHHDLYLFIYNFSIINEIDNKYVAIDGYLDEAGFHSAPDPSILTSFDEIGNALDVYKTLLNHDCLVLNLSEYTPTFQKSFTSSEINQLTQTTDSHLSYQGFGLDRQGNIYISSGFSPDKSRLISNSHVYVYKTNEDLWFDIDCNKRFAQLELNVFPEMEGLQVLDTNNVLITLALHNIDKPNQPVVANKVYRLSWNSDD